MAVCPACPSTATKSFPVALGFSPTHSLYETLIEPLNLPISWGSASSVPEFSQDITANSGELNHPSFDQTTLKYFEMTYLLKSVQITRASHNGWLALTDPEAINSNNQEDVILTFMHEQLGACDISKPPSCIILVSPIVRITRPIVGPAFITALANHSSTTLDPSSLFPNNPRNQLAYYTTCAKNIIPSNTFQNVLVVVNVQGLLVWSNTMEAVRSLYNPGSSTGFPNYIPDFAVVLSETPTTIPNQDNFKTLVSVSKAYASSAQPTPPVVQTVTDSYKCVPLNPETDLSGGSLYVNRSDGTLLSNTLAKRQLEKDDYNSTRPITVPYGILKKNTEIFLIIMFTFVGLFILVSLVLFFTTSESHTGSWGTRAKMALAEFLKMPVYVVIAFICTFVGLIVGIFVGWNGTNADANASRAVVTETTPSPTSSPTGSASGSPSG